MSDQEHVIEVLNEENRRLFEENARLRSQLAAETEGLLKVTDERDRLREANDHAPEVEVQRLRDQRDTLLAAGKRYLYALSVANGTTGPDDRPDALEGLEAAISEVEGEK